LIGGRQRRSRSLLYGLVALVLVLGVLPLGAMARQDASGGTLTGAFDVGPGGCPECANPLTNGGGFTWYEKYFSKLMLYDVNFTAIEGDLAESWEINEDATQYTITLRSGVTWHDGMPFTSADVKFTIELAAHPDSQSIYGAKFLDVESIETPDELTVVLNLGRPNATLLDAFTFLVMLPKHALEQFTPAEMVESSWWLESPIGTGPFKWSVYEPGQYTELVAFDDYWRGRPKLDKLINRFFPEAGSAVIALRSGEIAFTYLSADEALALEGEEGITVLSGPSQVLNHLDFDLTDERFQDVRIRQAFMYAIDRPLIIEQLYQGTATAVPCAFLLEQYIPDGLNDYAYDPDMARQLLEEAGWDSSQSIEIVTYYQDQLSQDVLVTIQQMLADVGVTVTLRTVDIPTVNQIGPDPSQWEMMYAGAANGPDPDVMATHYESKEANPSVRNWSNIADPQVDELLAQGRAETDPTARAETYQQLCQLMNEQVYWMSLWVTTRFGGVSTDVQDFIWTPAPGGGRYYDAAELWSVTE
jgi:peptide/nickel transport system substrate-binding protein